MDTNKDLNIKILQKNDLELFMELIRLFEEVFEMKNFKTPNSKHLENLLQQESFNVFVALMNNKVTGGLTTYVLEQYYSEKPLAYIYDLAVSTNMQRKGIGKQLIRATKQYYRDKGFEEVFVQAEQDEEHVVNFYRLTNPTDEEKAIHFSYSFFEK